MSTTTNKISNLEAFPPKLEVPYNWRVLIVEDEPSIAEGIKSILAPVKNTLTTNRSSRSKDSGSAPMAPARTDHFDVVWANNPTTALELVKESLEQGKPFAMGFFDVLLGSAIDGIELLKQIHLLDTKIYAVFVTAYQDRSVDAINLFLGPEKSDRWDYINKPFTEGSILQKARNGVALWNLKEQKRFQDEALAEASNLLMQGDRSNTAATVGRSMAHEFGNLLMHIIGHAEIALLKNDQSEIKQTLNTILKAGETAAAVLGKFKKLNDAESSPDFKLININQCIDESLDLMAHEFKKRNIAITRPLNDVCLIEANYHSLVQVFMNLLINSSHAMENKGQVDISISQTNNTESDSPTFWVEISLRDYGPGIPEEILPMVMEPFFTTKGKMGTGLGLAICKGIIESEHHGEFAIANHSSKKGIEITIKLPTKQEVNNNGQ